MEISGQGIAASVQGTARYAEGGEVSAVKEAAAAGKSALLNSLEPGSYVYGQVQSSSEDGAVLVLENGQKLLAKLAEGVTLEAGQNVTLQVEKKQDGMVYMKPLFAEAALEMTAGKALKGAGFMNTPKNLEIVKELLELNMPVDKNTIRSILQKSVRNPDVPVKQLALLEKLGIPATKENIAQLKQYQANEHQIGKQMESLIKELGDAVDGLLKEGKTGEAVKLNQKIVDFLYEELSRQEQGTEGIKGQAEGTEETGKAAAELKNPVEESAGGEKNLQTGEAGSGKASAGEVVVTGEGKGGTGEIIQGEGKPATGEALESGKASAGETIVRGEGKIISEEAALGEGKNDAGEAWQKEGGNIAEADLPEKGKSFLGEAVQGGEKSFLGEAVQEGEKISAGAKLQEAEKSFAGETVSSGAAVTQAAVQEEEGGSAVFLPGKGGNFDPEGMARTEGNFAHEGMARTEGMAGTEGKQQVVRTEAGNTDAVKQTGGEPVLRLAENPEEPELQQREMGTKPQTAAVSDGSASSVKEQMFALKEFLEQTTQPEELKKMLSSVRFRNILEKGMKEAWQLKPSEFQGKDSVNRAYTRVEEQTRILGALLRESGAESAAGLKTVNNVQQNLEFMQDLNQVLPYVQLPLQMAGESAHGDLYVFKDKKKQHEAGEPFTAFLHLSMERLGDVDVYLSLKGQNVSTDISLEQKEVLDLFEAHIGELTDRLEKKGYQVDTKLKITDKAPDFMEDVLAKQAGGNAVSRYSFDVKA